MWPWPWSYLNEYFKWHIYMWWKTIVSNYFDTIVEVMVWTNSDTQTDGWMHACMDRRTHIQWTVIVTIMFCLPQAAWQKILMMTTSYCVVGLIVHHWQKNQYQTQAKCKQKIFKPGWKSAFPITNPAYLKILEKIVPSQGPFLSQ